MKYETIQLYGHKEYKSFLKENDIEIDFLSVLPDLDDNVKVIVTFRRVEN